MVKIRDDSSSEIVHELLDLIKSDKVDEFQKKRLCDIVIGLNKRTEMQKQRFIMFYKLDVSQIKDYSLTDLAREFNCTPSAIKFSLSAITRTLVNISDDKFQIIKDIYEQCKKTK